MKLNLPAQEKANLTNATLVCIDTNHPQSGLNAMNICKHFADFDRCILFTTEVAQLENCEVAIETIKPLNDREEYCRFVCNDLAYYLDSPMCLSCQWDGYIINPKYWNDEWLDLDYLGGAQHGKYTKLTCNGNSGFCLRSTKLLFKCQMFDPRSKPYLDDILTCGLYRERMMEDGIKFGDGYQAKSFCNNNGFGSMSYSFGMHGYDGGDPFGIKEVMLKNEVITIEPVEQAPLMLFDCSDAWF